MGDLKILINGIKKFYDLIEKHDKQIQEWVGEAKKPCSSIINQSIFLRAITPENSLVNTGFENRKNFRESLINVILKSLDDEFTILEELRNKINTANEGLHHELKVIENLYFSLREKNLVNLSELNPCSPALEHIITWCTDIWRHYHLFYLKIFQGLFNLNFENEESVNSLNDIFIEDLEYKKHIKKIRSFDLANFDFLI